jgi:hypothetical protein
MTWNQDTSSSSCPASPEQSWKSLLRSGHTPDSIHPSNQPHILKLAIKYLINMLWLVSAVPPRFTRKLNIGEAVQMSESFAGVPQSDWQMSRLSIADARFSKTLPLGPWKPPYIHDHSNQKSQFLEKFIHGGAPGNALFYWPIHTFSWVYSRARHLCVPSCLQNRVEDAGLPSVADLGHTHTLTTFLESWDPGEPRSISAWIFIQLFYFIFYFFSSRRLGHYPYISKYP